MNGSESLSIYLVHASLETAELLREVCHELGHEVKGQFQSCAELRKACEQAAPDLIITDVYLPDGDGIETLIEIGEKLPIPAILVTADSNLDLVERAVADHVMAYLVEPVRREEVKPAIHLVVLRFQQFNEMREEIKDLRQTLEARKVIERAKGIVMQQENLAEDAAFRKLQKTASARRMKLVELANEIIQQYQAEKPTEASG